MQAMRLHLNFKSLANAFKSTHMRVILSYIDSFFPIDDTPNNMCFIKHKMNIKTCLTRWPICQCL